MLLPSGLFGWLWYDSQSIILQQQKDCNKTTQEYNQKVEEIYKHFLEKQKIKSKSFEKYKASKHMKTSVKPIIALVVVSLLTSFLSSESTPERRTVSSQKPPTEKVHIYDKQKCDSLEIEHRIKAIDNILVKL